MSDRPRIGIAGVHGHGRSHVGAALALAEQVDLVGVADPRGPGEVPGGVAAFDDARAMIDAVSLDIVILSTPIQTHLPLALAALERGAHVLLEKPPVTSVADHETLVAAAGKAGRAVQVGFQSLASDGIDAARDAAASGSIGAILHVGAVGLWSRSEEYWRRARWSGRRELDGVVVADGAVTNPLAHALATALAIAGAERPGDVSRVELDLRRANDIDTDDTSSLVVELATGGLIAAGLAVTAPRRHEPYVLVRGSRGHLVYHYTRDLLSVYADGGALPRTYEFSRRGLLADLASHATVGGEIRVPLTRTGAFTRVLEQIVSAPAPVMIDARLVDTTHRGETFRVVRGVEQLVERVAWDAKTFRDLGGF